MVALPFADLWQNKALVVSFSWYLIKIRYKANHLGLIWAGLEPMLFFVFLHLVFTSIKFGSGDDFSIYLLTGIVLYHAFAKGTNAGLSSLRDNANLVTSLNIRREFFPVSSTSASAILLMVEVAVFFMIMPFIGFTPTADMIFLPLILGLLLVLILGMSYILSIVYTYVTDIRPLWGVIVQALFFITPVFWRLEDAHEIAGSIQMVNPIGQLVELAHGVVIYDVPPVSEWAYTTAMIFGIFAFGYVLFHRLEKNIAERI